MPALDKVSFMRAEMLDSITNSASATVIIFVRERDI